MVNFSKPALWSWKYNLRKSIIITNRLQIINNETYQTCIYNASIYTRFVYKYIR